MTEFETLELEFDESNKYVVIFLNRPQRLNALNYKYAEDMSRALRDISKKDNIRCVIITGKGRAFSVGGDIVEFKEAENRGEHMFKMANKLHEGIEILSSLKAPSLAAVNGDCFGAALGLVCACDLRICSENARFGSAFTGIGASTDSSISYYLPRIVGLSLAKEMVYLNRVLSAEEALKFNLVSRVIGSDLPILAEARKIALKISQGPVLAFERVKKLFNTSFTNDLKKQLNDEAKYLGKSGETDDFLEGLIAFLEKRKPNFKGE